MGSIEGFARQVREISKLKFGPSAYSAVGLYIIPHKKESRNQNFGVGWHSSSLMLKLICHVFAEGM